MKALSLAAAFAASLMLAAPVAAQDYPNKPVRIIVPYQPGQGTDVATRFIAEHLTRVTGQSFVVENRAGAGGNIGSAAAARAAPDGYTLLMGTSGTHVLNQFLYASMPFDPDKDFEPIMLVGTLPMVVVAPASSRFGSVSDVLAEAKAKPDSIDVALPSTTARLVLELLQQQTGTSMHAVQYKGSGASMTDLVGQQVPLAIDTVSAARSLITGGKIKALGVTSLKDSALLPGVKSVADQAAPGFEVIAWNALYAPHGTPAPIVRKLRAEVAKILEQPDVRQRLIELGIEPVGTAPVDLGELARNERRKWAPLIEKAGLKAN